MYSRNIVELEDKIKWQEATMGDHHPAVAETAVHLAHLYFVLDRCEQAESLLWRATTIRSQNFGHEHLGVAALLNDLGNLYQAQGQFAEAEHVFRLAYAIKVKLLGAEHDDVLTAARLVVASCRSQQKHISDAELERWARVPV